MQSKTTAELLKRQRRSWLGAIFRRATVFFALLGTILLAGCSLNGTSHSHNASPAQVSPPEIKPIQGVSDFVLAQAAMDQFITNIARGSNLDEIHAWALKLVDQAPPTDEGRLDSIEEIPEFLRRLDPEHGPVAWLFSEPRGEVQIKVEWWSFPAGAKWPFTWGLVLGKPALEPMVGKPQPAVPVVSWKQATFRELKPGVVVYCWSVKESENKLNSTRQPLAPIVPK